MLGPGAPGVTVGGAEAISGNELLTYTVVGTGQVGVTVDLGLEVRDQAGDLVSTVNIGRGYPAGDPLPVVGGMELALTTGALSDGEAFSIVGMGYTDETGFL